MDTIKPGVQVFIPMNYYTSRNLSLVHIQMRTELDFFAKVKSQYFNGFKIIKT